MAMKAPRAKGNKREDIVQAMFAESGRYAVVLRGSGSRGTEQQKIPNRVAGDVLVAPETFDRMVPDFVLKSGIQVACGGPGKRPGAEFADLRDGAIPGYALACVFFAGMKPKRWLLADSDGGWTECSSLDDLLGTIEARS